MTVTVERYGKSYEARIIRSTPTRHYVEWTYDNGSKRRAWVAREGGGWERTEPLYCRCGRTLVIDTDGTERDCPYECSRASYVGP